MVDALKDIATRLKIAEEVFFWLARSSSQRTATAARLAQFSPSPNSEDKVDEALQYIRQGLPDEQKHTERADLQGQRWSGAGQK